MRFHYVIFVFLLLPTVVGCQHKEEMPSGVLSVEEYADVLTDLYLAEGYFAITSDFQVQSLGDDMVGTYDTLLAMHGVSYEVLTATTEYYLNHREENKRVYELLTENLEGRGGER